jgi:hypothetical protein
MIAGPTLPIPGHLDMKLPTVGAGLVTIRRRAPQ